MILFAKIWMASVVIIYTIVILTKFGWQKSYSMSYYNYNTHPFWKYAFSFFCFSIGYPAIILGATPLIFFAGVLIMLVGVAGAFLGKDPEDKEDDDNLVWWMHMIGAYGGIILAQLSIAIDFKQYWVNAAFVVLSILILIFRNKLPKWENPDTGELEPTHFFWIELVAILSIIKVLI